MVNCEETREQGLHMTRKTAAPITVLSLNPAVDMTYEIDHLVPDQKVHAQATRHDPGGNGINVARGLKRIGASAHCFCVLAGEIGSLLDRLLRGHIDTLTFERVAGETRINGTAIERHSGAQYEISGIGPDIPGEVLDRLLHTFVATTGEGFAVITGSIQPEVPRDTYARLVERVRDQGGRPVVDARGDLLRLAIEARPFLIKPNRYELEQLVGKSLGDIEKVANEARRLQRSGVETLAVSLGADGLVFVDGHNSYHASTPRVRVDSTVGAGDSMVAGLVTALHRGDAIDAVLRLAIACGAGTVQHAGTELFQAEELPGLMERVTVDTLDI